MGRDHFVVDILFQCLSEPNERSGMTTTRAIDYFYNYSLGCKDNGAGGEALGGVSGASLTFSSSTIMNGDGNGNGAVLYGISGQAVFSFTTAAAIPSTIRHFEGATTLSPMAMLNGSSPTGWAADTMRGPAPAVPVINHKAQPAAMPRAASTTNHSN